MSDRLAYIDAYFQKELNETERKAFEQECTTNENFAEEVANYVMARQVVREQLLKQKQEEWKSIAHDGRLQKEKTPVRKLIVKRILPFAIAASVLFAVVMLYMNNGNNPQQYASKYVSEHYIRINPTMSTTKDSLSTAIEAYNNKEYQQALKYFSAMQKSNPADPDLIKYSGFVYLMTKEYDNALQQFNELAGIEDIKNNPGRFLSAVTLILRNKDGDKAAAKQLLQQVIDKKLEGYEDAGKLVEGL